MRKGEKAAMHPELQAAVAVLTRRGCRVTFEQVAPGFPYLFKIDDGTELTERQFLSRAWDVSGSSVRASQMWPVRPDPASN